jgi:hypothetical protein
MSSVNIKQTEGASVILVGEVPSTSPEIQAGSGWVWAFLNEPWPGTFKPWAVPCPPDGLLPRLRHDTSLVKLAVPGWHACPTRRGSKPLKIFVFPQFQNLESEFQNV